MKSWLIAKKGGYEIKDNLGLRNSKLSTGEKEDTDSNSSLDYEEMQDER